MEGHTEYEFKDNLNINIIRTNDVKRRFYSYTEYVLEFKALNSQKVLKKRFSDFVTFYDLLKNELLDKFSEYLEKISVLPSKRMFGRLNYNFVEERRHQLELFLKRISSHKNVYLCDRFYDFLCLDNTTKCLFKLMCTEMTDLVNLQKLLKKINYILFLSRSNTLKSAECDIINFLFHLKKNLQLNNEIKFFILNIFLHHLTYTKTPENLLKVPLMKFAFEIIYDNLRGENINEVLLKTASETILRIVDKKNDVFLEYLQIYNFKEIFSIFNILSKRRKRKKENNKTENISFNVYILMSLLLLSSIHLNAIQNYFSVKNKCNKGIVILGYMYESQNINIQVICCIILSLLIMNEKINDEEVVQKTKMSILLIQKEIQNLKDVDYQLIEIICSKKNMSLLNNILVTLLRGKRVVRQIGLGGVAGGAAGGVGDENEFFREAEDSVGGGASCSPRGSFSMEGNPLEKDPFYEQKVKHADFSNNDIILQFILFIINIGVSEFFLLKRNYKDRMKLKQLQLRQKKQQLREERLRRKREKKERAMLMLKDEGNMGARRLQGDNGTKDDAEASYLREEQRKENQRVYNYDIESVDEDCVYKREYVPYDYASGREPSPMKGRGRRRGGAGLHGGLHAGRDIGHQRGGTDGGSDLEGEDDEQWGEEGDVGEDGDEEEEDGDTDLTDGTDEDSDGSGSSAGSEDTLRGDGDDAGHGLGREHAQVRRGQGEKGEAEDTASTVSSCISSLYSFSSDCTSGGEKEDTAGAEKHTGAEKRVPPIDIDMSPVRDVTYEDDFSVDSGSIKDDMEYLEGAEHNSSNNNNNNNMKKSAARRNRGDSSAGTRKDKEEAAAASEKPAQVEEGKVAEPDATKESDAIEAIKEEIRALRDARKKYGKRIRRINEQILLILCNENMVQSIFKCANLENEKIRMYACLILSYVPNISEVVGCTSVTPGGGVGGSSGGYLKMCCSEDGLGASTNSSFRMEGPGTSIPLPEMQMGEFAQTEKGIGDDICVVVNESVMLEKKNNKNFVCSVEGDYYNYIYRFEIVSTLLRYLLSDTSFHDYILQYLKKFIEDHRHLVNLNHFKIKQTELINMVSFMDMRRNVGVGGSGEHGSRRKKKQRKGRSRGGKGRAGRDRSDCEGGDVKDTMVNSGASKMGLGNEGDRRTQAGSSAASGVAGGVGAAGGGGALVQYETKEEEKKNNYQCVVYEPSQIYDHMDYVFRYVTNLRKLGLLNNLIVEMYNNLRKKVKKVELQFIFDTLNRKVQQREQLRRDIFRLKEKYEFVNVTYNEYINLQYETNKQMGVMNKLLEELEEIEKRRRKSVKNHKAVHTNVCNYRKKLIHIEKMIEESPSIKKCLHEELNNIKRNVALYKKDKKKIYLLILLNKFCLDDFNRVNSKLKCLNTSVSNLELLFNEYEKNINVIVSELSYLICNDLILLELLGDLIHITVNNDNLPHLIARANCINSFNQNDFTEKKLLIVNRDRGGPAGEKRNILHFTQSSDLMGEEEEYGYYDARDGRRVSGVGATIAHRPHHHPHHAHHHAGRNVNGMKANCLNSSDSDVGGGRVTNAKRVERRKQENFSQQNRGRVVGSDDEDTLYPHEGSELDGSASRRRGGGVHARGNALYEDEDHMRAMRYGQASGGRGGDRVDRGEFLSLGSSSHQSASHRLRAEGTRYEDVGRQQQLRRQGHPSRSDHHTYDDEEDEGADGVMSEFQDMHSMNTQDRRNNIGEDDQNNVYECDDLADTEFVSSDEEDAELKEKIHEYNTFKNKEVKGVQPDQVSIDRHALTREVFEQMLQVIKARKRELEKIMSSENNQVYKNIHKFNSLLNKCNTQIELHKKQYGQVTQQIASINTSSMVKKSESIYKAIREWDDKINLLNEEVKVVEGEKKEKQKEIALHKKKLDKKEKEKSQKKEELRLLVTNMYKHNNYIKKRFKREQKVVLLVLYNSWFMFHYIYIIYLNTLKLKNYLAYKHSISEECQASAKQTINNISQFSELLDENDY
ncbi:hypothetical protein AK88_02484 [Plasmodium fragile]|uniref:PX domain-containing protein n=1 Tax=Plasmodium fragile TaxID=5857 RepID=A0A0D9QLD3_PLAFR|nr:uncharacterized protein AK88_02484 [Plasmodium fragile]KJP87880.1 hypothetical protein AK88_02484 [Plasmodium fragile]